MNQSNVLGCHSVFYYYGVEHLALNLSYYLAEARQNNDLVYISMEPQQFQQVMDVIKLQDWQSGIRLYSIKELIVSFKNSGQSGLKAVINRLIAEAQSQGFNGIRCIGHSHYAIVETSLEDFLACESGLNDVLSDTQFALMCLYDIKDLLYDKSYSSHQIIAYSLAQHPYIFYQLHLKEINSIGS